MKKRGITVLELLISSSLFLLALVICGELAVVGVRSRNHSMDRNSEIRKLVTAFQTLQRELKLAEFYYGPDLNDLAEHRPGLDAGSLVVGGRDSDGQPRVSGWRSDGQQLIHGLYRNDFHPTLLATHQLLSGTNQQRTAGVIQLKLRRLPPGEHFGGRLLWLEIESAPPLRQRLATTVETSY